jgi:outer membrane protein TolC
MVGLLAAPASWGQSPLGLQESVDIALAANDPSVALFEERAQALEDRAIADSQLPDPVFSTRIQNVPLASFDLNREGMTQLAFGVRQAFPKGSTRALTRRKREAEALIERQNKALRDQQIALQTRTAWLEVFYWKQAKRITRNTVGKVKDLTAFTEAGFANGQGGVQNVLRLDLESALLENRLIELERKTDMARADLTRMIGIANAARPLADALADLPSLPAVTDLQADLIRHPAILIYDAKMRVRDRDVDLAQEQYKPGFAVDAAYGVRDSRSDFGSIGVSYSIPLFEKTRQDRNLSASRHLRGSTRLEREAQLLELNRQLGRSFADWTRLGQRMADYKTKVIPRAKDTAEAAMLAYETEAADFAEVVRAELAVLDAELALTRLQTDRAKAHANLLFLQGRTP